MGNRDNKAYISQKAILLDEEGKILTLRRTQAAPSRPLHWDFPGGDMEIGEDLQESIAREIREEAGLEVRDLKVMDAVGEYNDRNEFWVTICYVARPISKEVVLSYEHDRYQWVTPDELSELNIPPKIQRFIERFKPMQEQGA